MTNLAIALLGITLAFAVIAPVAPHILPTIHTLATLSIPLEAAR